MSHFSFALLPRDGEPNVPDVAFEKRHGIILLDVIMRRMHYRSVRCEAINCPRYYIVSNLHASKGAAKWNKTCMTTHSRGLCILQWDCKGTESGKGWMSG